LFVHSLLVIPFSVICFTASDYSFGILKFLTHLRMSLVKEELLTFPGFFFTCPVVHVGKLQQMTENGITKREWTNNYLQNNTQKI
jgi:hypothetical protein